MKEEKFKIIQYIRELIISIDENLDNFPKKDIEIKNRIRNASYDILEVAYMANTAKEKKIDLLYKLIAKLKVVDKRNYVFEYKKGKSSLETLTSSINSFYSLDRKYTEKCLEK